MFKIKPKEQVYKAWVYTHGEIKVTSITFLGASETTRAWYINLDSKYAEIGGYGNNQLYLCANEHTLYTDPNHPDTLTIVRFELPEDEDWHLSADVVKWSVYVLAHKTTKNNIVYLNDNF